MLPRTLKRLYFLLMAMPLFFACERTPSSNSNVSSDTEDFIPITDVFDRYDLANETGVTSVSRYITGFKRLGLGIYKFRCRWGATQTLTKEYADEACTSHAHLFTHSCEFTAQCEAMGFLPGNSFDSAFLFPEYDDLRWTAKEGSDYWFAIEGEEHSGASFNIFALQKFDARISFYNSNRELLDVVTDRCEYTGSRCRHYGHRLGLEGDEKLFIRMQVSNVDESASDYFKKRGFSLLYGRRAIRLPDDDQRDDSRITNIGCIVHSCHAICIRRGFSSGTTGRICSTPNDRGELTQGNTCTCNRAN